jgi:hypothetical protein
VTNKTRKLATVLSLFGVVLMIEPTARAQDRAAKERAARKACLSGSYVQGVDLLSDLFIDTKDPMYIFNQGRCFQQNNRYDEALGRFREYLRMAPNLSSEDRATTEKHIADCQAILEASGGAAAQPPAAQPSPAVVAPPPTGPVAAQKPAVALQDTAASRPESSGSGLRTAGVITAAIGGAALVAGVLLNLKANSIASDISPPNTYLRNEAANRADYETASWIGYGVGAAGIAGGTVLYLVGRSSSPGSSASATLVPSVSSRGVGALLQGAF